ncbi:hypothetical protein NQ038_03805 [Brevibacterium sp. 50QC2O2]|uniref:hypothetical protein n=1 Tax=Brevibacterium TaxID=1696 RepID=UPI00211CA77A|nr:hypothetical protein [Brevibacterium sp. 91QC2O2]MCQ9385069.1 hypothetical protein [Brevibacterium sp. 68QC2CO]MCQ9387767.1 hypothetical protein [Brevibacterium sp. 50QC2O2]
MDKTESTRVDAVMLGIGVVLAVIGGLSIVVVLIMALAGATPSRTLTWIGMITLPIAFILLMVEFLRLIRARRA